MPRLTRRRFVILAVVMALIYVPALLIAAWVGALSPGWSAVLGLAGAILFLLLGIGLAVNRLNQRVQAALRDRKRIEALEQRLSELSSGYTESLSQVDRVVQDLHGAMGEHRIELLRALHEVDERLDELVRTIDHLGQARITGLQTTVAHVDDAVGGLRSDLAKSTEFIDQAVAAQERLHERLYSKIEAQFDVRAHITPRAPLPLLGGWAVDADVLHTVTTTLWERRPELVVECGSGSSSVWLGYILEQLGSGRLISLEHDPRFAAASRNLVRAHGLSDWVEIRLAPLQEWIDERDGRGYQWYTREALSDLKEIGVLIVDGPPGTTGPQSRYPAGPLLLPRCSSDVVAVLDDTNRQDERDASDRWLREWPSLRRRAAAQSSAHIFNHQVDADADVVDDL